MDKRSKPFTLQDVVMYKLSQDNRLCKCVTIEKDNNYQGNSKGIGGGHFVTNITTKKILNVRCQWPTLFKNASDFCRSCNVCQQTRKLATRNLANLVSTCLENHSWNGDLTLLDQSNQLDGI